VRVCMCVRACVCVGGCVYVCACVCVRVCVDEVAQGALLFEGNQKCLNTTHLYACHASLICVT